MTVSYSREVATSKLGTFARLLFRWKGSIYRLLYREMILFLFFYYFICAIYHFAFNEDAKGRSEGVSASNAICHKMAEAHHSDMGNPLPSDLFRNLVTWEVYFPVPIKGKFEKFAVFCQRYTEVVPLTFVLGFYVSIIVGRWWNIFSSLNWPDRMCLQIQTFVSGEDERGKTIRRSAARYLNLSQVLVLRDISTAVKKRFPTLEHLIDGGFVTDDELKHYENVESLHHKFWVPLQWTCSLLQKARKESRIDTDPILLKLIEEVLTTRNLLSNLLCYDWVSVPLVYTQVVTIAVYSYFLACLFGRQFLMNTPHENGKKHSDGHEMDMYFPLFTVLQFFFYMGWLKVAESIMNPLGEDDDDFEVNYLIDRNLQVSYSIVDENCMKIPPLKRDIHWNEPEASVPHTQASAGLKSNPPVPSASNVDVKPEDAEIKPSVSNLSLFNPDAAPRKKSSVRYVNGGLRNSGSSSNVRQNFKRLVSTVSNRLSRSDLRSSILVEEASPSNKEALLDQLYYTDPNHLIVQAEVRCPSPIDLMSSQKVIVERQLSVNSGKGGEKPKLTTVSEVANEEVESNSNLVDLTPDEKIALKDEIVDHKSVDDQDDVDFQTPLLGQSEEREKSSERK